MAFVIEDELKKLPDEPGVYLMHGEKDKIIYVGKARSLTKRVHQYFQNRSKGAKIDSMVTHITRFEYIVTDSEAEALVLECNLIKEHRPKYNTMLMDDKAYPYIRITTGEAFPRIMLARRIGDDRSRNKYFGPYVSAGAVRDTIELIRKLYKLRSCSRKLPADIGKERPCLNYHIGQCDAPCQGCISRDEYDKYVKSAIAFLNGHYKDIIDELNTKMLECSDKMDYEKAAEYRDLIGSIEKISQKQKITTSGGEDRDIIAVALGKNDEIIRKEAVAQVFFIRAGRMIGRDHYYLNVAEGDKRSAVLESFIKQFYAGTPYIPREIMLKDEIEDREEIEKWLSQRLGSRVRILVPQKGTKEKLVELAEKNAVMVLEKDSERLEREYIRTTGAMEEIREIIGLDKLSRIEAYDISNTSGFESVGSMIVFENGSPKKSDYRKFRIRSVEGPNDYASLREVLMRRLKHEIEEGFMKFPDLIMMDGGKGQVHIAEDVMEELDISIPVCGMVKDDNHRTRGLYYADMEMSIDRSSEGFKLITRIQDEAHRFAVEYHKSLRSKEQVHSILDDIPEVGEVRRRALRKKFTTLEEIRDASLDELAMTPGMTMRAAKSVYDFFHSEDK